MNNVKVLSASSRAIVLEVLGEEYDTPFAIECESCNSETSYVTRYAVREGKLVRTLFAAKGWTTSVDPEDADDTLDYCPVCAAERL